MLPITYRIEGPWQGQMAIIPRSRGGDWLNEELHALKEAHFNVVLSLLTREESEELGLAKEAELSAQQGLEFINFPIPDLGVPAAAAATHEVLNRLLNVLRAGKRIAIHCRQGIGRSGLIAASLLVMEAIDPFVAFRRVSAARGLEVPETTAQRDWVMELSHRAPELART